MKIPEMYLMKKWLSLHGARITLKIKLITNPTAINANPTINSPRFIQLIHAKT
jgi:hypothetical protein